jgi:hypothetical protein
MLDQTGHDACVNAWMAQVAKGASAERLVRVFERGFTALWHRARQTLGDFTLTAIVDRVLYTATARYPALSTLGTEAGGLQYGELHEHAGGMDRDQLADGIRFVLVEFLTVLGHLTAEILSPALHETLAKVAPDEDDAARRPGGPPCREGDGEGHKT